MISTITTTYGGLRTAAAGFEKAANNVVKATTPGSEESLPAAIVGTKTSEVAYKANIAVFKTADKMLGELLDTMV